MTLIDFTNNQNNMRRGTGQFICRYIFFDLGFLSQAFTINKTADESGSYLFNYSLPLPLASKTFRR